MTECNGCGSCCDPVVLPYTQEQALGLAMDPADKLWTLQDLTPISQAEAEQKEPEFVRKLAKLFKQRRIVDRMHYFSCRHFDTESRTCRNYDARPPVCQKYPWLGGEPIQGTPLPPACSFRADIGQSVVEIRPKLS